MFIVLTKLRELKEGKGGGGLAARLYWNKYISFVLQVKQTVAICIFVDKILKQLQTWKRLQNAICSLLFAHLFSSTLGPGPPYADTSSYADTSPYADTSVLLRTVI